MTSLLTNMSAMSALQNLAATQKSLGTVQSQISSGLRVATASDNAAYWSISTTMKSDTGALSAVTDALNLGSSTVGVATAALNSTITILNTLKNDLVTAQTPAVDVTKVQTDIAAQQAQLQSITASASFNGVNLLQSDSSATGYNATTSIVASFSRDASGAVTIGKIGIDTSHTTLIDTATTGSNIGLLTKAGTALAAAGDTSADGSPTAAGVSKESILGFKLSATTSTAALKALSTDIDAALAAVTTAGTTLGATKTRIDSQSTFVSSLSDAITSGVGTLVDADMNVASTRLQALQTQQQLGIQSLSIANQNSQLILKLFGGG